LASRLPFSVSSAAQPTVGAGGTRALNTPLRRFGDSTADLTNAHFDSDVEIEENIHVTQMSDSDVIDSLDDRNDEAEADVAATGRNKLEINDVGREDGRRHESRASAFAWGAQLVTDKLGPTAAAAAVDAAAPFRFPAPAQSITATKPAVLDGLQLNGLDDQDEREMASDTDDNWQTGSDAGSGAETSESGGMEEVIGGSGGGDGWDDELAAVGARKPFTPIVSPLQTKLTVHRKAPSLEDPDVYIEIYKETSAASQRAYGAVSEAAARIFGPAPPRAAVAVDCE
jgi:hypothetical protein